jgi:transcription elongation GreA/GreB family factor
MGSAAVLPNDAAALRGSRHRDRRGPIMIGNIPSPGDEVSFGAPVELYYEQTETVSGKLLTICQWRLQN